jgi:hypothetical protein
MQTKCRLGGAYSASAKLLIKDEARRIASNIAKLRDLLGKSWSAEWGIKIDRATEETLMSRKQRQPLFMMATFTLCTAVAASFCLLWIAFRLIGQNHYWIFNAGC